MLKYLKEASALIIILTIWAITGIYYKPVSYGLVIVSFIYFLNKKRYSDTLIAFFCLLIYSDSYYLSFAKDIKPYASLLMGLYVLYEGSIHKVRNIYGPFIPFFLYALFLLSFSETLDISFQKTISYTLLYFYVPAYMYQTYVKEGTQFFKHLFVIMILIQLAGLAMLLVSPEVAVSHGNRYRGIFGNPNGIGLFCVFIYILQDIIFEYFPNLFKKREQWLFFAVSIIPIIWSGSRTSMVSLFLYIVLGRLNKHSTYLMLGAFISTVVLFQFIDEIFLEFVHYFELENYFRLDTIKDGSGRLVAWEFAWEHIQKNMLFGKGFDYNQYIFFTPENRAILKALNHEGDVHNIFLGFWLDVGLIGLIVYFSAFIYIFITANRYSRLAFPCMLAYLFMGNYEPWLIASLNPYTIQMLLTLTIIFLVGENIPLPKLEQYARSELKKQ